MDVTRLQASVPMFLAGLLIACLAAVGQAQEPAAATWLGSAGTGLGSSSSASGKVNSIPARHGTTAQYILYGYFAFEFPTVLGKKDKLRSYKHWTAAGFFQQGKERWGGICICNMNSSTLCRSCFFTLSTVSAPLSHPLNRFVYIRLYE